MLQAAADPVLRVRAALRTELAGLEKRARDHAKIDSLYHKFVAIPGIVSLFPSA
ncbi:hypothetical protein P775_01625 [Puniceibacterium antarcticum]|uniref:Uncharacterized protein n=1 Tax=Puniceibacterium antarcticum TaxID=1206336 RepID=A0A2G8RKC3_9RHOB|nr:hypothetical protein P775_01625 [Puniceibacterium antarcticum]